LNPILKRTALLLLLSASPAALFAADSYHVSDERLKNALSDVPCLELGASGGTELTLSEVAGSFKVSDPSGVQFSGASVNEAADGYLRLKSSCVIKDIRIDGLNRITADAVMFRLKSAKGDIVHLARLKSDVEAVNGMGYFEKVTAEMQGDVLVFKVAEHPVIVKVSFSGNKEIKDDKLTEALGIKKFEILNMKSLKAGIDRMKTLYREKGYYDVEIKSDREDTEGGIELKLSVTENKRLYVKEVNFDGNEHVKTKELRKLVETKNRWLMGLLKHSGNYIDSTIDMDLLRIEQYYGDIGYIDAKVGRPVVDIREGKGIYLTIPISEGKLFHVASTEVSGDMLEGVDKETLSKSINLKPGEVMSRSKVQKVVEALRDIYMDQGYAFAKVEPESKFDGTDVHINFVISKGEPVHINKITINGNTKTREHVIRRELAINESDLFSSTALKTSKDRLGRLGYFKESSIEPVPGPDGKLDLKVGVAEKPTGAFICGISYSTENKVSYNASISENNLFGKGYRTQLKVDYGKKDKTYTVDLEDPWFMDTPLSVGGRVYAEEDEKLYYVQKTRGFNIRMSYPLVERWRHSIGYSYEKILPLEEVSDSYLYLLSKDDLDGGITSKISNMIYRDTTNDPYRPTHGSDVAFSIEYAGLSGDKHFTRFNSRAAVFFPLYKDMLVLMFKNQFGVINGGNGEKVPDAELYELGGLNTLRGFEYGEVGPRDSYGNTLGSRVQEVFNVELTCPIPGVPGLSTVAFFDAGNGYQKPSTVDLSNIRKTFGGGLRWVTPMGPLRLEYGRIISPRETESTGRWEFNMGAFF